MYETRVSFHWIVFVVVLVLNSSITRRILAMAAFASSLLISQYEVKRTQPLSRDITFTDTFTASADFTVASRCMNSCADIFVLSKYTMRMFDWTDGRSTRNVSHLASDIAKVMKYKLRMIRVLK